MYEIGTDVRYHGSITALQGQIFTVVGHCCDGQRHILASGPALRHIRAASLTPTGIAELHTQLQRAITAERPLVITYVAADGEQTTRTIEPYELVATRTGHLIVRAMDHRSGRPRSFRLERIHTLTAAPGAFRLPRPEDDHERAALARLRAAIGDIAPSGYGEDSARWRPGDPIL
ncbi:helix-turn-helix transcriptional regulator [Planobispora takensis]|uniref:WYL domain-containing protein n=1 Tax=Planobispora takensis TaxID=1367882 RepID=A0A8J3T5D2_9ACTN|nr:WYL domain-containing protein [Planobispora takensis]GII05481.1 hypothetical protein Pta02_74890 [Planobispora takensis]